MRALIVGVDGQDGYFLSEYLLESGYEVYGVVRKKAVPAETNFIQHASEQYHRIYADLNDFSSLLSAISETRPDEIYNLAGQSEIPLSWKQPLLTAEVNALGVLRLLEAIRVVDPKHIRFFQASSSEMFGNSEGLACNEDSPMRPRNPYGSAKLFAHNCVANYRSQHGIYACSGIMFNHESPRRSPDFVTRKITMAAAAAAVEREEHAVLSLGNLSAVRDWGCALDYVRAMWALLQRDKPQDVVIATGEPHTVRDFATEAFYCAGRPIFWEGEGLDETARFFDTGELAIRVDPAFVRYPLNDKIISDPKKLYEEFGFKRNYDFHALIDLMVQHDIRLIQQKD